MTIKRYTKKPVTIEAMKFDGTNVSDILQFVGGGAWYSTIDKGIVIPTLEGNHLASSGDYIIKGIKGEFYPCKPDIFSMTYDEAT